MGNGNFGLAVVIIIAIIVGLIIFYYGNTIFNFADDATNSINLNPANYITNMVK